MSGPLEGLLVADFSRVLAGPFATMLLGDLGADVVKVEHPAGGDETRGWGPPWYRDHSTYYLAVNRNKRSVALDLRTGAGRRAASALAARADVLVENFKAGAAERLGLGYEEVGRDNPGLVWCSISGFGRGPGADLPGYDFLVQAMSGLMSITGPAGGEPTKVGVALVDVLTGLYAFGGVLAALRERDRTGRGQRVEVSLLGSALASLVNQASSFLCTGRPPRAMGNRHPSITPYETLATADRPLVVAVGNDGQFARLCRALGRDELAADPRFATNGLRCANVAELDDAIAAWTRTLPAAEAEAALEAVDVPCSRLYDIRDCAEDPHFRARDTVMRVEDPLLGPVLHPAAPFRFQAIAPREMVRWPGPAPGQHNAQVFGEATKKG